MEEDMKGDNNRNLITILIVLVILVIVAVIYWDHQSQLAFQQIQAEMQGELLEAWGPQAQQQIQAALQGQPVAFSRQVSYKNIVARIAPSVVSVNVGSSFINQGELAQNVWGGKMGGWGTGPGSYLFCPNCRTSVPCQRGVPAYTVNCPSCGIGMIRGGAPWTGPIPGQTQQLAAQNQPAAARQKDNEFQARGRGGSGVIVSSRGYVLTNHHVVHGARNITVTLSLGRITKTYPAELIDEAPDLDFAILKIVATGNEQFIPAPIGNSGEMSVGDEVLALGSPFGLQQSVTFGIVSNTQRTLTVGNKTFTNFIQTDAPINPGSSGGPLINVNGEVIAITTAIYSPTQAFSGIGFASPIDPAKAAFPEFIDTTSNAAAIPISSGPNWALGPALKPAAGIQQGQGLYPWYPPGGQTQQMANTATRPWLGIRVRAVDKGVRGFLGLPMAYGVLVMEVYDDSPCRAAGLQRGDVIIRADNRTVKDEVMLEALLVKKRVGDKMKLTIYRDGKKMNLRPMLTTGTIGPQGAATGFWGEGPEWPEPQVAVLQAQPVALAQQPFNPGNVGPPGLTGVLQGGEVGTGEIEALGMELTELSPELAMVFGVPEGVRGLVVAESAAQAAVAGLMVDDVIEAINGQRVETIVDFIKAMNNASLRDGISLGVYRQGQRITLTMRG